MGIDCKIVVTKPEDGYYKPGQVVTGYLKYVVDKPTECKSITLFLVGIGKRSWVERIGWTSMMFHEKEEHVIQQYCIDKDKVLNIGSYEHPYSLTLPLQLPRYFRSSITSIRFRVRMRIETKCAFRLNLKCSEHIPLYSAKRTLIEDPRHFSLNKTLFKLFSTETPVIKLNGILVKNFISPGENALIRLEVQNDTDIAPIIKGELICCTLGIAEKPTVERIRGCTTEKVVTRQGFTTLFLTVPTKPNLCTMNTAIVMKQYRIRINLKLPLPHKNAFVDAILVIR